MGSHAARHQYVLGYRSLADFSTADQNIFKRYLGADFGANLCESTKENIKKLVDVLDIIIDLLTVNYWRNYERRAR